MGGNQEASALSSSAQATSLPSRILKGLLGVLLVVLAGATLLCCFHRGYRRSVDFWTRIFPLVAEYKILKTKCYIQGCSQEDWLEVMEGYHRRTAPRIVKIIVRLGGIYVKVGQFLASIGGGMLDDAYVTALQPLQEGMPPRSMTEIAGIVQQSLGKSLDDLFGSFDPIPIGAASIAQAHKAVLKDDNRRVIVKVQYPFVAEMYEADLDNLELAARWIVPDTLPTINSLRERHIQELDFRREANNMREISENMHKHGLEPKYVRIPKVYEASQHVLIMDFLEGISLGDAIEAEHDEIASSLGMSGGAKEMRAKMMDSLKDHLLEGGGQGHLVSVQRVAPLVRAYTGLARTIANTGRSVRNGLAGVVSAVTLGSIRSKQLVVYEPQKVDLDKVLKMLVKVHGVQAIQDGVYNADPHPGNVIIMPCGRLGLIDYGMVGRLTLEDRELIASTVIALYKGDKRTVVRNYNDSGYVIAWRGGVNHTETVIHRCAMFHLDRFDLSPVLVDGMKWPILELLASSIERSIPDWIQQMKRLGGLLIGVTSQAGRPISLSKEWNQIARKFLKTKTRAK